MSDHGLVTDAGRTFKARHMAGEDLAGLSWFAIGDGDWADKFTPPVEEATAVALAHEIARKQIERYAWLELDEDLGTVLYKGQLYKEVAGPTPIVVFYATLTEDEANGVSICEMAIFGGPVVTLAAPYALAAEVTSPGIMYWVRHRPVAVKTIGEAIQLAAIFEE